MNLSILDGFCDRLGHLVKNSASACIVQPFHIVAAKRSHDKFVLSQHCVSELILKGIVYGVSKETIPSSIKMHVM